MSQLLHLLPMHHKDLMTFNVWGLKRANKVTHHSLKPLCHQFGNYLVYASNHTNRTIIFEAWGIVNFRDECNVGNATSSWKPWWSPKNVHHLVDIILDYFPCIFYESKIKSIGPRVLIWITWCHNIINFLLWEGEDEIWGLFFELHV